MVACGVEGRRSSSFAPFFVMLAILSVSIHSVKVKNKEKQIQIRVSAAEKNRIRTRAGIYADGNVSRYMLDCEERAPPRMLKKKKGATPEKGSP